MVRLLLDALSDHDPVVVESVTDAFERIARAHPSRRRWRQVDGVGFAADQACAAMTAPQSGPAATGLAASPSGSGSASASPSAPLPSSDPPLRCDRPDVTIETDSVNFDCWPATQCAVTVPFVVVNCTDMPLRLTDLIFLSDEEAPHRQVHPTEVAVRLQAYIGETDHGLVPLSSYLGHMCVD